MQGFNYLLVSLGIQVAHRIIECWRLARIFGGHLAQNQAGYWEKFLLRKSGNALAQAAQRGGGVTIPGGIQGQAGCGSGQPGLVIDDPAHSRGVETS